MVLFNGNFCTGKYIDICSALSTLNDVHVDYFRIKLRLIICFLYVDRTLYRSSESDLVREIFR